MATLPALQTTIPLKKNVKESLTVVIIVTYAHPYIGSGLGVVAKSQAEYLAAQGHNVTLISSNIPKTSSIFMLNGVTYIKVPALALLERFHIPVPLLFFNQKVIDAIRNANIVHVHDILYPSSLAAALLAKLNKKHVILTQHVPHVQYPNKVVNAIERLAFYTVGLATLYASDAVVVLTESVHQWISQYKDEVYYLPNGVDTDLFYKPTQQEKYSIRERYDIPHDKFVVLFVGRFVPKKGFDILYKAKDPDYLLVFVGGGIIPEYIKSDDEVRILGPLPQEELALLYRASDTFILPSFGEGFPLSIQEAMSTGLPIITSKQNNLDRTLDSPLISYIEVTEANIRSAIKSIKDDSVRQKEMSEYSHKIATEHYSWKKNSTKLADIYRQKIHGHTMRSPGSVFVTTSWDDGHKLDVRLAALLKKYGIKGTFYVCLQDREFRQEDLLKPEEVLAISKDFEIGGHTITHPHLTRIPLSEADREIAQSKIYLEGLLQREITAFCYPYGDYNSGVKNLVKKHGYKLARTTRRYSSGMTQDMYEMPTTFHTYAHYSDLHKMLAFSHFSPVDLIKYWDWEQLAIALFERTCQSGGIFHLWGHSWEIEKNNGWQKLENVLAYIAKKQNLLHQTNTELLDSYHREKYA